MTETDSPLLTRSARLDRLTFGSEHKRLLIASGIGWALDAMDVSLISFVMAALAKQWALSAGELSVIGSIGFLGMAIGATLGGLLADRIGRRSVFALTLLIYGLATGATALAGGVAAIIVLRFIVGIGLGAELPVASTLVSEFAPKLIRGRVVVALESFWAFGWIMAALIGYFLVPGQINGWEGWRWAMLIGIIPAFYALVIRNNLPESVRYLESQGDLYAAEVAVRRIESGSGVKHTLNVDEALKRTPVSVQDQVNRPGLFTPEYRKRTIALWLVWFFVNLSYYGAFIWLPTLLYQDGHDLVRSFRYTLIMTLAQLPGYAVAAWLIEVWGRRSTLITFLAGSAVSAAAFGAQNGAVGIIFAGCALSFFNLGAWGALYAVGPEIFPTALRGAGTGSAAAVGRVAGILAPLMVPWLGGFGGRTVIFSVFGISFLIAAVSAFFLPERRAQDMVE